MIALCCAILFGLNASSKNLPARSALADVRSYTEVRIWKEVVHAIDIASFKPIEDTYHFFIFYFG